MDRDITKQKWENVCLLAVLNRCICPYIPDFFTYKYAK